MSIIPWPAGFGVKNVQWDIDQPGMANRAEFTGARRVTLLPQAPRWYASFELVPAIGEANVLEWRAFVIGLRGIANAFRLPATEGAQILADPGLVVDGANQGGYLLNARGGTPGAALKRGMLLSVADLLVSVMAPATVGSNGKVQIAVEPYLRVSPADGAPIALKAPTCLVSAAATRNGWSVDPGQMYGRKLQVEEAF